MGNQEKHDGLLGLGFRRLGNDLILICFKRQ